MYVCMYVCMYAYRSFDNCLHTCTYVRSCARVYMYTHIHVFKYGHLDGFHLCKTHRCIILYTCMITHKYGHLDGFHLCKTHRCIILYTCMITHIRLGLELQRRTTQGCLGTNSTALITNDYYAPSWGAARKPQNCVCTLLRECASRHQTLKPHPPKQIHSPVLSIAKQPPQTSLTKICRCFLLRLVSRPQAADAASHADGSPGSGGSSEHLEVEMEPICGVLASYPLRKEARMQWQMAALPAIRALFLSRLSSGSCIGLCVLLL